MEKRELLKLWRINMYNGKVVSLSKGKNDNARFELDGSKAIPTDIHCSLDDLLCIVHCLGEIGISFDDDNPLGMLSAIIGEGFPHY